MEQAYKQHRDSIFRFSLYLTGDRQVSEDIVHDVFLKLANQKEGTKEIQSVKDWLFICARNLIYNYLKKKSITGYVPIQNDSSVTIEQRIFIEQILGHLKPEERELILLREQQRYSIGEISKMIELSEEAVRVRLFRIRKKMQVLAKE